MLAATRMSEPPAAPALARSPWGVLARFSRHGVVAAWVAVTVAVLLGTQACNAIWAFANPAPHHWDNADYLNQAYADSWAYADGALPEYDHKRFPGVHRAGLWGVWDSILHLDVNRPPAYRVVSLPLVYLPTRTLPTLRAASLAAFWLTLYLVYRTARTAVAGPAGVAAGAVAAALCSAYLEVGWAARIYGTEYTLYLAVAAMVYCYARAARPAGRTHGTWVGLGFALGLGALSKLSFVLLAAPAGGLALILILSRRMPGLTVARLLGAAAIGAVVSYPYYRYHLPSALGYAKSMTGFERHALHRRGLDLVRAWLSLHCNEGMGPGAFLTLAGLAAAAAAVWGVAAARRRAPADVEARPALVTAAVGLAAGVPMLLFQLGFSDSDNVRHMTPAYLPITVAVAVAAAPVLARWLSWPVLGVVAFALFGQVSRDFFPLTTTPDDVWDWEPLYRIVHDEHGLRFPYLGRVGNYGQFNEPSLEAPWRRRGDWAVSHWLWRAEDGPLDWPAAQAELVRLKIQVVVTAPGFTAPADGSRLPEPVRRDNADNAAFAAHMAREPGWLPPERFPIGTVNKAEVWVFVRDPRGTPATRP